MLNNRFNVSLILALCLFVFTSSTAVAGFNNIKANIAKDRGNSAYENKDYAKAFKEYQFAAERGDEYCQFMLACMYIAGEGVNRNSKKYYYWIQQAADQGYPPANYLLGRKYLPSKPSSAVKYFKLAAKKEHESSMYILGLMYAAGNGVSQSISEALAWFRRAKAQGFPVEKQLLTKSGIQSYLQQKSKSHAKAQKQKLAQQKMVREIQQTLAQLGYNPGPIDGLYGKKTRAAIQAFQKKEGLKVDGEATVDVLRALRNLSH